jgi:hypothetical protein
MSGADSGRPLRVKRGLFSLQISDQLFCVVAAVLIGLAIWFAVGSPLNRVN